MMISYKAMTIFDQLGGTYRLSAMIKARDFVGGPDSAQFSFSGCRKFDKCRIVLDGDDTYTLQLCRYTRLLAKSIEYEVRGLHFNQLIIEFERATGLYLTL